MPRRPGLEKVLIALAILTCVFAGTTVAFNWPETHFVALSLTGRLHEQCGWRESARAALYERARMRARLAVARQSTLVTRDGHLSLWQSPQGRAWIQNEQGDGAAAFWAGDLHHGPPRWAQLDVVPVLPVREGSIVIDAGGHIGESANQALKMGASLVVSIEPDPLNAEALRRNLADAIQNGRLKVIEKALWDTEGTLTLERHDISVQTQVKGGDAGGIEVAMTTLDRLVEDLNLSRVDFIKMDIEGAEQPALRGAIETLKRHRPILAIGSYHKPDDIDGIRRIVLEAVPAYRMTPLRCLTYRELVIPALLYFHVAGG